jgi:hypothetical protein
MKYSFIFSLFQWNVSQVWLYDNTRRSLKREPGMSYVGGLKTLWQKCYAQCKQYATWHAMQRSIYILCGALSQTESFKSAHSDYGHRSGCPVSAESVTWKTVKQFRWTRNVNIPKFIRQSTVVTETSMKGVSETLSVSLYMLIPENCTTKCNIL